MNFYVNHLTNCKVPIETTNIPNHLDKLLDILLNEENLLGYESPGPCLEYLLQHRLLDLLATLASAETPPGMRFVCLSFLRRLLTRLQHPLLPHVSVYSPVQRLIGLCNGSLASPTENEEIQFLVALCFLICKHPNLTYIMNNVKIPARKQSVTAGSVSSKLETQQITYVPTRTRNNSNPLFEPLNTQAVTLINPSLHNSENKRRVSSQSSQSSFKTRNSDGDSFHEISDVEQLINSDTVVSEHKRKISNLSNASLWYDETEFASPLSSIDFSYDDKSMRKVSNGSDKSVEEIESKLKDLRELRIESKSDSPFEPEKPIANYKVIEEISKSTEPDYDIEARSKTVQSSLESISSQTENSKCLLLDALISYLNSAVGI